MRLILSVAAIKGFRVLSHDFKQVYVESEDKLSREIYLLPKKRHLSVIGISDDGLLELLRPLCGFCNYGDYWGVTVKYHAEKDLGMLSTVGDLAFYMKMAGGTLDGVMGVCVE